MTDSQNKHSFSSVKSRKKAVVLLSSGIDSSVNLFAAHKELDVVLAITFDYGQRAAAKEIFCAGQLAKSINIAHRNLSVPFIKEFGKSSLTTPSMVLPVGEAVGIEDFERSQYTAKSVWVPNRNGIFLNIAAGFAEALDADFVIPGFNKEEATTFPDNSLAFLEQLTKSFSYSTANHVQVLCYTTSLVKTEIVALGKGLNVDFGKLWPCYQNFEKWCGQCESCQRARRALQENAISCAQYFL